MGRKTQVTREQMLEAGLKIVIRDGHNAVSIKTVAAELGCSTTPIAWSFENIDNYRKELRSYAMQYMNGKMTGDGKSTTDDHRKTGDIYVDMAIDEPNLIRYLRSDERDLQEHGGIGFIFDLDKVKSISEGIAKQYGITEAQALGYIRFVTTYTEGVVSMILSGVYKMSNEDAHKLLTEAGEAYMIFLKSGERK